MTHPPVPPIVPSSSAADDDRDAWLSEALRHAPDADVAPPAALSEMILRAAQAWAMMQGRRQVLPEDVQAILPPVVGHRLHGNADAVKGSFDPAKELIAGVPIP